MVDDLRNHPLASFVSEGLPVVISSDDPGFWGASAVNFDWWVAALISSAACPVIGLLKQLALNSIEHSLLSRAERNLTLAVWSRRWDEYVQWLVAQHEQVETE